MHFDDIKVGAIAERQRPVTDNDVVRFAEITGDLNPVHIDADFAKSSMFGERIAHGMLTASHISAVLGMEMPGPGAIYLSQTLRFTKAVYIGDVITARVEVLEVVGEKRRIRLRTVCLNQRDEVVLEGEALLMVPASSV